MRWSKYHSTKIPTSDGKFDSKREYKRWLELKALEEQGLICELHRQIPFELIPKQVKGGKVVERAVKYVSDFSYITADGVLVIEDAKGFKTPEYIIKRKLMLWVHGIQIKEV